MATQFPLFSTPNPQEAMMAEQAMGRQQDMETANMDPLKAPRFYQAQAARALSGTANAYFGNESPAIKKAKAAQQVMKMTQESGIDYATEPEKYMDTAIKYSMQLGQYELAQQIVAQKAQLAKGAMEGRKTNAEINQLQSQANNNDMSAAKSMEEASVVKYKAESDRIRALGYQVMAMAQQAQASGNQAQANVSKVVGGYLKQYYELLPKIAQAEAAKSPELEQLKQQGKQLLAVIELGQKQMSMQEKFQGNKLYSSQEDGPPAAAGEQQDTNSIDLNYGE